MTERTPNLIAKPEDALEFAFGGSARFTLVSKKTGTRYTYRIKGLKSEKRAPMFAQLLTGPDNTEDYTYLGYFPHGAQMLSAGKKGNPAHPAYKALDWTMQQLLKNRMPEDLEFWHEGRCRCCGRVLTDPDSIAAGIGPECAKKGV